MRNSRSRRNRTASKVIQFMSYDVHSAGKVTIVPMLQVNLILNAGVIMLYSLRKCLNVFPQNIVANHASVNNVWKMR